MKTLREYLSDSIPSFFRKSEVKREIKKIAGSIIDTNSIIKRSKVTLNHAQILAWVSGQITIIPAPGTNKLIIPISAWVNWNFTGVYGNIDPNCTLDFWYSTQTGNILSPIEEFNGNQVSIYLTNGQQVISQHYQQEFDASSGPNARYLLPNVTINQAFVFTATNGLAGNFTGGNSGDTMDIYVYYMILDLT